MAQIRARRTAQGEARYDVRSRIAGRMVTRTFKRRRDADAYARTLEADRLRGLAVDPRAGLVMVEAYAQRWLQQRQLRPLTRDLYAGILRKHILPTFGERPMGKVTTSDVRAWNAELASRLAPATVSRIYRVLHAIFATAVEDEILARNPCIVRGASSGTSPERPVATIAEVNALVDAIEPSYRAMVVLAAWCGLRLGELLALTRRRVNMLHGTVEVVGSTYERFDGTVTIGPPKTAAGRRKVSIPPHVLPEIERHLREHAGTGADAPLFPGPQGGVLYRKTFARHWRKARRAAGVEHLHFHDLRHTGNTLAAATGASTKELMARMGHANPRAALLYQHATADRDRAIAEALSELAAPAEIRRLRPAGGPGNEG